ncbi:hypothetical protein [Streptomyces sp. I05A-00742]|uniref:hypothetical protein n=1 Tax=Streptomyces sp. I05A-00742 TaxID=2732853 RepID=UPI001488CD87|nr:hypothetical protein [Streptomyces sp. I05A-00742]
MDFTVIANAVEVDDGIKRVSMRFIKKYAAPERSRLSQELCEQISKALEEQGLITLPRRLPTSENDFVFVIQKDCPLGQAVEVATHVAVLDKLGANPLPVLLDNFPGVRAHLDR